MRIPADLDRIWHFNDNDCATDTRKDAKTFSIRYLQNGEGWKRCRNFALQKLRQCQLFCTGHCISCVVDSMPSTAVYLGPMQSHGTIAFAYVLSQWRAATPLCWHSPYRHKSRRHCVYIYVRLVPMESHVTIVFIYDLSRWRVTILLCWHSPYGQKSRRHCVYIRLVPTESCVDGTGWVQVTIESSCHCVQIRLSECSNRCRLAQPVRACA